MHRSSFGGIVLAALALAGLFGCSNSAREADHPKIIAPISIDHFTDGQTLRYSTPFLQGSLADLSIDHVIVTNLSSTRDTRKIMGMADHGRFKVFTELMPGLNHLRLTAGDQSRDLQLIYKPQTNPHCIMAVLFTDKTGNTHYDTPLPNDAQDYRGKFDTVLKIMQSYSADWMDSYGYGPRTYNLELDENGKVIVHIVKGSKTAEEYYKLDRNQLYDEITTEVKKTIPDSPAVACTLIAFSKLDPATNKSLAYTALGGGQVALFGGACMYSFPNSLSDVQNAFTDPTPIDNVKYVSDSIRRYTFWATASTSIGAMLHEMGHSMGLPHSDDPRDIMTRGIDNFGRYFVFYDPPSQLDPNIYHFKESEIGYWSPVSAAALTASVWFDLDKRDAAPPATPVSVAVELSPDGNQFIIRSPRGIAFVGYEKPGAAHHFKKIDLTAPLPQEVRVDVKDILPAGARAILQFRIIDGDGYMSSSSMNKYTSTTELLQDKK